MNRERFVRRALESVRAQTAVPREVLVVDDASTDATAAVAARAGARVLTMPQRSGSGPARNAGIEAAGTEWIAFLDSDDEWHPSHLRRLLQFAEDRVMVTAPARTTGGRMLGNPWGRLQRLDPVRLLVPGDLVVTSGTMVRRDVLLDAGLFRQLRRAQDLDMWLRVLERGPGLALAEPTVLYQEHEEQASKDEDLMRQCFDRIVADYRERPWMSQRALDGAYVRWMWDEFRAAQRRGDARAVMGPLSWFAVRPHALPVLGRLLRQRRLSRRG